jgi:glycosyltransferase involved in cell wall biosynthesis
LKKILFLTQSPIEGPASRVRVYQYLPYLKQHGFDATVLSALPSAWFKKYYTDATLSGKLAFFGRMFFRRINHLLKLKEYDAMFLQREVIPYFPPFFEKVIRKKAKRLIFDFDDAIYHSRTRGRLGEYNKKKIGTIISWCDYVIAGNEHLASFARAYHSEVHVIPSGIDTEKYVPDAKHQSLYEAQAGSIRHSMNSQASSGTGAPAPESTRMHGRQSVELRSPKPVIVWMGTPSSMMYLKILERPLEELHSHHSFIFRVIGANPGFFSKVPLECIPWELGSEVRQLQTADIGIMPLFDGERERGKCGYKLLQYMACGLPVVASPVGVNQDIVKEGINGFLAGNEEHWKEKLTLLLGDQELKFTLGQQGRKDVETKYSIHQTLPKLLSVLEKAVS